METGSGLLLALALMSQQGQDSVYGVVRDAVTGAPLPGVLVVGEASGAVVASDSVGVYSLSDIVPGPLSLSFQHAGYESFRIGLSVAAKSSLRLDPALDPLPLALPSLEAANNPGSVNPHLGAFASDSFEIGSREVTADAQWSNTDSAIGLSSW